MKVNGQSISVNRDRVGSTAAQRVDFQTQRTVLCTTLPRSYATRMAAGGAAGLHNYLEISTANNINKT